MLYIIGTGLTPDNISLKSIEILRRCKIVYLEGYTSMMNTTLATMESLYGCEILPVCRKFLESTDTILHDALEADIALLVIGTPFFATTHSEILVRARKHSVSIEIVHNAGIQNVMGMGFFSYNFGKTVSIPFFTDGWKPFSVYEKVVRNYKSGFHSLCLLDIQVVKCGETKDYNLEHSGEDTVCQCNALRTMMFDKTTDRSILRCLKEKHDSVRYMTADIAIKQLLEIEKMMNTNVLTLDTEIAVICRFGASDQKFYFGKVRKLLEINFGFPLHALIIPGKMEVVEKENVVDLFECV